MLNFLQFLEWSWLFLLHKRGALNLSLNSAYLFIRAVKVKFLECSYLGGETHFVQLIKIKIFFKTKQHLVENTYLIFIHREMGAQ